MFLAITLEMYQAEEEIIYEIDSPIYKWLGKHFDVVQHLRTYGARCITPFIIKNSHFLAVANFQNNHGSYSSNIFR